jgi:hypothetical protein
MLMLESRVVALTGVGVEGSFPPRARTAGRPVTLRGAEPRSRFAQFRTRGVG